MQIYNKYISVTEKSSRKKFSFYIPADLNIDDHIKSFPPTEIEKFDQCKLLYILHLILYLPTVNEDNQNKAGYTHLSSELLRKKISDYKDYLDYLKRTLVIKQLKNRYSTKLHFSKSYRVNYNKFSSRIKRINIYGSSRFLTSLTRARPMANSDLKELKTTYSYITQWLDDGLKLDMKAAMQYIDYIRLSQLQLPYVVDSEKINAYLATIEIALDRINEGDISYSIDKTSGRLHSNLTNFKKEFRHFLTYKGESLVSLDIRSCQPYLSQLLLNPEFWYDRTIMAKKKPGPKQKHDKKPVIINSALSWLSKVWIEPQSHIGLMATEPIRFQDVIERMKPELVAAAGRGRENFVMSQFNEYRLNNQAINEYINCVNTGDIYNTLLQFTKKEKLSDEKLYRLLADTNIKLTRDAFKLFTLYALYAPLRSNNKMTRLAHYIFRKRFPAMFEVLRLIKRAGYKTTSIMLQAVESEIMINRVCKKINAVNHRIPFFTIHDSILTTVKYQSIVEQIMKDELAKAIGFAPTITVEQLSPKAILKKPIPTFSKRDDDYAILLDELFSETPLPKRA